MGIALNFFGAARNVTGSRCLLEIDDKKILIDCGIHQERELRGRDWDKFPVEPSSIDALILTHAHLDHCGYIPKLVKDGFKGKIHATAATAEIAQIVMIDCGHIQEYDSIRKAKRHAKRNHKSAHEVKPLYTEADARLVEPMFDKHKLDTPVEIGPITITFRDSGHILGSALVEIDYDTPDGKKRIVFSGDLGRPDTPILRDPVIPEKADYVVMESTYGNRMHKEHANIPDVIADVINRTIKKGGRILVPSFSIERAHELMYYLNMLVGEGRIPRIPVFLDSPMAVRVTEVFENHAELYDKDMNEYVRGGHSPFKFDGLKFTLSAEDSKAINDIKGPAIIIAGSGMCTGGRIKHHLERDIEDPSCTVMFVGYQAYGTLGRSIVEKNPRIRIFGRVLNVKAEIAKINGFSGHADRSELLSWVKGIKDGPGTVIINHGEETAALAFEDTIHCELNAKTIVPNYRDRILLD